MARWASPFAFYPPPEPASQNLSNPPPTPCEPTLRVSGAQSPSEMRLFDLTGARQPTESREYTVSVERKQTAGWIQCARLPEAEKRTLGHSERRNTFLSRFLPHASTRLSLKQKLCRSAELRAFKCDYLAVSRHSLR